MDRLGLGLSSIIKMSSSKGGVFSFPFFLLGVFFLQLFRFVSSAMEFMIKTKESIYMLERTRAGS